MKSLDLYSCENELKMRWELPYVWGKKQNDEWDNYSNFIYDIQEWEQLRVKIKQISTERNLNFSEFLNYSANRWYNFKSAIAVESVFSQLEGVQPNLNPKDRLIDFTLSGIDFDLKTSVFPNKFGYGLLYAQQNPEKLINWLYANQSSQGRQYFANRLFLIVFSEKGEHWKLKAEILWLKKIIEDYITNFDKDQLQEIEFQSEKPALSDIIWAVK